MTSGRTADVCSASDDPTTYTTGGYTVERYNGWKNYETWNVHLWLANDEPMYRETVRRVADGRPIREYVESIIAQCGTFGDLGRDESMTLEQELGAVDWDEIEAAWRE